VGVKPKDAVIAVLAVMLLISAAFGAYEYSTLQAAQSAANEKSAAETVYNLQGVAIEVSCCPRISSGFVVGNYYFAASEISPIPARTINGTLYPRANGTLLSLQVHPLSNPTDVEGAGFAWYGFYNVSVPFPGRQSLFGGGVVLQWYVLAGLLYLHVETTPGAS
jgi:hypothetical protein